MQQLFRVKTEAGAGLHAGLLGSAGSTPTHRSATGTPTHRARGVERRGRYVAGLAVLAAVGVLLNWGALAPMDPALVAWSLKGCPQKILELTTTMEAQYQARRCAAAAPPAAAPPPLPAACSGRRLCPLPVPATTMCDAAPVLCTLLSSGLTGHARHAALFGGVQAAVAAGLDPELGQPVYRKPKTAILNFVR